jgi:hypothetical protein
MWASHQQVRTFRLSGSTLTRDHDTLAAGHEHHFPVRGVGDGKDVRRVLALCPIAVLLRVLCGSGEMGQGSADCPCMTNSPSRYKYIDF